MEKQHCAICDTDQLVVDGNESICMNCGYMTNSTYNLDNKKEIEDFEKTTLPLVVELKQVDKKKHCNWYPSVIDFYKKGLVFPKGTKESWGWCYAPYAPIMLKERITKLIPGTKDLYYEYKPDFEHSVLYDKYKFKEALQNIGPTFDEE